MRRSGRQRTVVSEKLCREVSDFLFREAELLDERRFREWLDLIAEDATYVMPLRVTEEQGKGFLDNMFHFEEDKYRLTKRVERLETDSAWAENPPSRTRHFVSNIRVEPGEKENEVKVKNCLLLYRSRGEEPHYDILSAERQDVLRQAEGAWRLGRRVILLDQTTVATHNLSIFL
jgi:3-phenylpropionate/cinnamic acid dioxygenase small subunit